MKAFVQKILSFFFPIITSVILIELLLRCIPNDYKLKKEIIETEGNKIKTLILGSSHSYYGINPVFLKNKSFNLSNISQSLNIDYKLLKHFEGKIDNVEKLILPISYFSLFEQIQEGGENWRLKNYNLYYKLKISNSLKSNSEFLSNKQSFNAKRLFFHYVMGENLLTSNKNGWGQNFKFKNQQDLKITGKIASQRHTLKNFNLKTHLKYYTENINYLENIIRWADKNKVKLILFTPPAYKTYYNNLDSKQLNFTLSTIKNLLQKYPNVTYKNFLKDRRFLSEDFYDADHLSEIGAKKLTLFLDKLSDK